METVIETQRRLHEECEVLERAAVEQIMGMQEHGSTITVSAACAELLLSTFSDVSCAVIKCWWCLVPVFTRKTNTYDLCALTESCFMSLQPY